MFPDEIGAWPGANPTERNVDLVQNRADQSTGGGLVRTSQEVSALLQERAEEYASAASSRSIYRLVRALFEVTGVPRS